MAVTAWIIIAVLFAAGMVGAVYPALPGALAIYAAFFVYGFMIGFGPLGFWFWFIQTTLVAAITAADYLISARGVRKYGGTRVRDRRAAQRKRLGRGAARRLGSVGRTVFEYGCQADSATGDGRIVLGVGAVAPFPFFNISPRERWV